MRHTAAEAKTIVPLSLKDRPCLRTCFGTRHSDGSPEQLFGEKKNARQVSDKFPITNVWYHQALDLRDGLRSSVCGIALP